MANNEVAYDRRTASGLIHKNSCYLVGIVITPKENNKCYVDVYDGENTGQEKVFRLRGYSGTGNSVIFPEPILMRRGLYVAMDGETEEVTVFWKPIAD